MKRSLLSLLFVLMVLSSGSIAGVSTGSESNPVSEESKVDETEKDVESTRKYQPSMDVETLSSMGIGSMKRIDVIDPTDPLSSLYDTSWIDDMRSNAPAASPLAEESDSIDDPFYAEDGDLLTNNVSSTIDSQNQITFDDEDYYQINLTSDGVNSTVDRLELTVSSEEAEDKNASLTIEVLQPNFFLGQFMDAGFESVGKFHGNTTKIVIVPDGDDTVNLEYPIIFRFRSWNSTMLNFSMDVEISSTTRTEWNGLLGGGPLYNATNKPSNMQSVNRSHDFIDWFDLSGAITDEGMDTDRGDQIRFGLNVDIATEERGSMYNPYGLYGVESPTTSIVFVILAYYNYTARQMNVYFTPQESLPFASMLFQGADPLTLTFQSQANYVWLGVTPLALWGDSQGQYYQGAEGNAEVFFNVTQITAQLIPPNSAPRFTDQIEDQEFDEDTGPWNITDLMDHFYDEEHADNTDGSIPPLDFQISKPVGVTNPDELKVTVKDGRYLWANVTEPNWHGEGEYRIKCKDWGVADPAISIDDREARSNSFIIDVNPVNDDAYIEKIDTGAGQAYNKHEIIDIFISENSNMFRSKKVYGRDNDTEDQNRLVYTHNATTPAFRMNTNGQVDFIPTNDDVGDTYVRIWVDDRNGDDQDDHIDLRFVVSNTNDPPELTKIEWSDGARSFDLTQGEDTPTFKNVREDMEINLTVTATDPDILIGEPDSLTWVVGANGWNTYKHPTDPLKAYVTYTPDNEDAVRTMVETKLSCMDTSNSVSQEITVKLMVENINDPPVIETVNNEIPREVGGVNKIILTEATGTYAMEDELFSIHVEAEDIDPRDSITFKASDPAFQFFPDPVDDFAGNFSIRPTQDMVGMHTVVLTVEDEEGDTDSVTVDFEVVNTNDPPFDTFKVDWETNVDLVVGNNITFFVEDLDDPDEDELTVIWDFGDNTEEQEGEIVTHSFANDQSYIITVTVRDPSGAEVDKTTTITIYEPEEEEVPEDLDSDGDGMPDIWEDENGLNKNKNDSMLDEDEDGFTNLEEFNADTNPLDPRSHPAEQDTEEGDSNTMVIVAVLVVVVLVLVAMGFLLFALTRKPKPAQQQQAYAPEMPPGGAQQLPGQGRPGLPQQQQEAGQGAIASPEREGLPPADNAENKEDEGEELMDSFLDDAAKQIEKDSQPQEGEDNVWRPPAQEEAAEEESQVDDLFAEEPKEADGEDPSQEPPEEEEGSGDGEADSEDGEEENGPPKPPEMPSIPKPPEMP